MKRFIIVLAVVLTLTAGCASKKVELRDPVDAVIAISESNMTSADKAVAIEAVKDLEREDS